MISGRILELRKKVDSIKLNRKNHNIKKANIKFSPF